MSVVDGSVLDVSEMSKRRRRRRRTRRRRRGGGEEEEGWGVGSVHTFTIKAGHGQRVGAAATNWSPRRSGEGGRGWKRYFDLNRHAKQVGAAWMSDVIRPPGERDCRPAVSG